MRTIGFIAVACVFLLAGCPQDQNTASGAGRPVAAPVAAAVPGGTLRLPLEIAPDDPALARPDLGNQQLWALARAVELPLVRASIDGAVQPGLAASWQSDDSGTVWTFTLDERLAQLGDEFKAKPPIITSWLAILRGDESPLQAQLGDLVAGAADLRDGRALELRGIEYTWPELTITLTRPNRLFPLWVSQPGLGDASLGPFTWADHSAEPDADGVIKLKPNPAYPYDAPLLSELWFVCQPDRDLQLEMYRAGELDTANVPANQADGIQNDPAVGTQAVRLDTAEALHVLLNRAQFPWDDVEFQSRLGLRQAMNWGLNRPMIAELNGYEFQSWPHFLPAYWQDYIDPQLVQQPLYPLAPQIEAARQGLHEADLDQGLRLPQGMDLSYLPEENLHGPARDILDYWREISVKMIPFCEPRSVLFSRIEINAHQAVLKRIRPAYPDPDALFYPQLMSTLSGLGGNWSRLEDESLDAAIRAEQAEQDDISRRLQLRDLSRELEERALMIFIGYATPVVLISPELAGYRLTPYDFDAALPAQDFTELGWRE
ncbi:hypothetical protein JW859_13440 [bacterium]|nr:hypothetical protein [bacterium]